MPKYSVLETILIENPDFDAVDQLTAEIIKKAAAAAEEIEAYLKNQA